MRWVEGPLLEQMICQERLTELGLFTLTKLLGDLRVSHSCLKGSYKNDRAEFFSVAPDWPQTVVYDVEVRALLGGQYSPGTGCLEKLLNVLSFGGLGDSARQSLTFSSVDDSPALSRRLDCLTSRSLSATPKLTLIRFLFILYPLSFIIPF